MSTTATRFDDHPVGFDMSQARWYDPSTERWIAEDPIFPESGSNPYEYCGNDPVNETDPSGLADNLQHIVVLVDQDSLPTGFDANSYAAQLNKQMAAKGVNGSAAVTVVSADDLKKYKLGFNEATRAYTVHVTFKEGEAGTTTGVAAMANGSTDMSIDKAGAATWSAASGSATSVNMNTIYANSILREVLLHGVLGQSDDKQSDSGFYNGQLDPSGDFDIPQDALDKINQRFEWPAK